MTLSYRGCARELLQAKGIEDYDIVRVIHKDGIELTGILIPRAKLEDDKHIVLKLKNGYNVGISLESISTIELVSKKTISKKEEMVTKKVLKESLPRVPLIVTGGTITSKVDYATGAVKPYERPEELLDLIPEISEIANLSYIPLMSIFSENMTPQHWIRIAKEVEKEINSGSEGVIIAHGTDTMHFTAAALSFLLEGLFKPVILVGAQRSIDRPSTDAVLNLLSAVKMAVEGPIAESMIVMHGSPSDDYTFAIRGVRARKMHTSRRDAFLSINEPPLAKITRKSIEIINKDYNKRKKEGEVRSSDKMQERIALIYSWPGIPPDFLDFIVDKGYVGLVLAGTGLGHVPTRLIPKIRELTKDGIPVVMTSQCLFGRTNLNVYETGRLLLDAGVIAVGDMLPEVALVKLMYAMGKTTDLEEIGNIMRKNLRGEISKFLSITVFPPGEASYV
ncbi:MAG TPA: Glu-tRNA(Gln) amidotransferase subunit GatD [Candidatus Korarchaeota archaeon]|nr:Glu-tRNA(Gln) amidotransferase subunit GatD [Candidatus Korarchaeota archaeon]